MRPNPPLYLYQIQRQAYDAEAWQWIINLWRRLTFRPVLKTGKQRYREVLWKFWKEARYGK